MKASIYETLAVLLALCGALAFGYVNFPLLNPVQSRLIFGEEHAILGPYLFGSLAYLSILFTAWYFNAKAIRLKHEK